ncbi:hypothetical protein B0E42_27765 [Pseudomonas sp. A25(2017)]|nr:hypothetical protein B0E42_27765 [Pseudomonas sp. A25(2017)]
MWEQGLPAMKAVRSSRNRGGRFASKLCSHNPTGIDPLATMVDLTVHQNNKGLAQGRPLSWFQGFNFAASSPGTG